MSKLTPLCCRHLKMGLLSNSNSNSNSINYNHNSSSNNNNNYNNISSNHHPGFQRGTTQFKKTFRFGLFCYCCSYKMKKTVLRIAIACLLCLWTHIFLKQVLLSRSFAKMFCCTRGVGLSMVPVRASFIVGKLCGAVRN